MAGLLANCIDVVRTRGSVYTTRVREPRGASHTAAPVAPTSTDRLNNERTQHAAHIGPRPPQPVPLTGRARPARIGRRLGSLPSRIDRLGHQRGRGASCRRPLRPASTATAAASSARSCPRLPRPELAAHAAQSGERQRRSQPQTSRTLPGHFFCTPGGRSQRGLRRSPAPKVGAAFMGDSPPRQGTQW